MKKSLFSLIIVDQLLKYLILYKIRINIFFIKLEFYPNYKMNFYDFNFILILLILIMLTCFVLSYNSFNKKNYGIIFLFSGIFSNVLDYLCHGYVIDYIIIRYIGVFNLADIYIMLGIIYIIFNMLKRGTSDVV